MHNAGNGDGIGQHFREMANAPIVVDGVEASGVEEGVPVCEVGETLFKVRYWKIEILDKVSPASQVMVILVRFAQNVTVVHMLFVVVSPVLL
jgi:hypothetical protein